MKSDNEIIAEFMGDEIAYVLNTGTVFIKSTTHEFFKAEEIQEPIPVRYSNSWDWLMPVVQKIYSMYDEFDFQSIKDENRFLDVLDNPVKYPISDTYRKVVDLIKWLNDSVLIEREKDMKT